GQGTPLGCGWDGAPGALAAVEALGQSEIGVLDTSAPAVMATAKRPSGVDSSPPAAPMVRVTGAPIGWPTAVGCGSTISSGWGDEAPPPQAAARHNQEPRARLIMQIRGRSRQMSRHAPAWPRTPGNLARGTGRSALCFRDLALAGDLPCSVSCTAS